MKHPFTLLVTTLLCFAFAACIKDELPSAECDIEVASVSLNDPETVFFRASDTAIAVSSDVTEIVFRLRPTVTDLTFAPTFRLTQGAMIQPANGSQHDFAQGPVTYTVTSEDGRYRRIYRVSFRRTSSTDTDEVHFDFEHFMLDSLGVGTVKYYVWRDPTDDPAAGSWATGNAGYSMTAWGQPADSFPSVPLADGYDGHAVRLTTRSTGSLGRMVRMPIAAGNLFYGTFDVRSAMQDALAATRFGHPFDRRPIAFTGYYTYRPASPVADRDSRVLPGARDSAAIYAILYRNRDANGRPVTLDGTNIRTSPQIVATADMGFVPPTDVWTPFRLTFRYTADLDRQLLAVRGYSLAIVFSSSRRGDRFVGAVGSTLCIDKIRIVCEKE